QNRRDKQRVRGPGKHSAGRRVLDTINHQRAIIAQLCEGVSVTPQFVWAAELYIDEALFGQPLFDQRLPAEANAKQREAVFEMRSGGKNNWPRAEYSKAKKPRCDTFEIEWIGEEAKHIASRSRDLLPALQRVHGDAHTRHPLLVLFTSGSTRPRAPARVVDSETHTPKPAPLPGSLADYRTEHWPSRPSTLLTQTRAPAGTSDDVTHVPTRE